MNKQYFNKEQIKNGELNKFLNMLIDLSHGKGDEYNDIHLQPEDFGVVVEWDTVPWSGEWGGHWQYIHDDDDEVVMKYYNFPNGDSGLFSSKEEYDEALKEWLEEHKDEQWEINDFGRWYSKKEQEKWEQELNINR